MNPARQGLPLDTMDKDMEFQQALIGERHSLTFLSNGPAFMVLVKVTKHADMVPQSGWTLQDIQDEKSQFAINKSNVEWWNVLLAR
jgi:hypothetical protein